MRKLLRWIGFDATEWFVILCLFAALVTVLVLGFMGSQV